MCNYKYIWGMLFLLMASSHSYCGAIIESNASSNLVVDCGPFSGSFNLDCISKIPEIPDEFKDSGTVFNSDAILFESLGGTITNACNPVIITVNEVVVDDPSDCYDNITVTRTITISDQVTQVECISTYNITYTASQIISHADDIIVDCEENVDSLLQAWIDDIGGAEINGCVEVINIIPANPVIAFNASCDNSDPLIPNQRGNIRIQWNVEEPCIPNPRLLRTVASFIVVDNTPPELECPSDQTFDITDPDLEANITSHLKTYDAFEQCGDASVTNDFNASLIQTNCDPIQIIPILLIAMDTCSNSTSCSMNIQINNDTGPTIKCPDDITLECGDTLNLGLINNWKVDGQAVDYTGMAIAVTDDFDVSLLDSPFCGQSTTILFTGVDACGRDNSCTAVVTIEDTKKPEVFCPSDTTFFTSELDIVTAVNTWKDQFIAIDDCSAITLSDNLDINEVLFSCTSQRTLAIEFVAEDVCGNDVSCNSILTIESDYDAEINCIGDLNLECGDGNNMQLIQDWIDGVIASDNTGNTLIVRNDLDVNDIRLSNCDGFINVAFQADDQCGNVKDCRANIVMQDTTAPEVVCPMDLTIVTGSVDLDMAINDWLNLASATDNCGMPTISNNYDPNSIQGCELSITVNVEFKATDNCGLESIPCYQDLTIETDRLPIVNCPNNLIIDCGNPNNETSITNWRNSVQGFDFTGIVLPVTDSYTSGDLNLLQCLDSLEVTFNVIDNCNWEDSCIAKIIVQDTIAPSIICPGTLNLDSNFPQNDSLVKDWIVGSIHEDNCLSTNVTFDLDTTQIDICASLGNQTVLFTVVDDCSNSNECTSEIIINFDAPTINCPAIPLALQCGNPDNDLEIENWLLTAQAFDNTGTAITVIDDYDPINIIGDCQIATTITFTAIDTCGTSSTCSNTISVSDNSGPIIDCPVGLTVMAEDPNILQSVEEFLDTIQIQDCNSFDVRDDLDRTLLDFNCGSELIIPVLFEAIDSCGNGTACNFSITITNDVMLSIDCPSYELELECGNPDNVDSLNAWISLAQAEDNMGNVFPIENDFSASGHNLEQCSALLPVVFEIIDPCDSGINCIANVRITDTTIPEVFCPNDTSFIFGTSTFDNEVNNWLALAYATDNCGTATVIPSYDSNYVIDDCLGLTDVPVTFNATDNCNLTSNCVSILTVRSERAPEIICPNSIIRECGVSTNLSENSTWTGLAEGFDFDGSALVVSSDYTDAAFLNLNCGEELIVTFTMTNSCNLPITCESSISLEDTTPPVIICPTDITINATDPNAAASIDQWLLTSTAVDACTTTTVGPESNLEITDFCGADEMNAVVFIAMDECDNSTQCTSNVIISFEAPSMICPTTSLDLQCGNPDNIMEIENWLLTSSAFDNNGLGLSVTNDYDPLNLIGDCQITSTITFSAIDICGITNTCTNTISLSDTEGPTIDCPPILNLIAGDPNIVQTVEDFFNNIQVVDDCNNFNRIDNLDRALLDFECDSELMIPVLFEAIDSCGNGTPCNFDIVISNDVVLNLECPSYELQLECGNASNIDSINNWLELTIAEDNMGNVFPVENDFLSSGHNLEQCTAVIPVFFEIQDECNSGITCTSNIRIVDTTAPEAFCPNDTSFVFGTATFDSDVNNWLLLAYGTDNCGSATVDPTYDANYMIDDCLGLTEVPVTFIAEDACGLSANCVSILTVKSERAPIINCPSGIEVECGESNNLANNNIWLDSVEGFDFDGSTLDVTSDYTDAAFLNLNCGEELVVTFTMINSCNVPITCESRILLEDTTPPQIVCPDEITINATDSNALDVIDQWLMTATAVDACTNVTVGPESNSVVADICNAGEMVEVAFIAMDECNLSSNCTVIIVVNKEGPEISCPSSNLILECGGATIDNDIQNWISQAIAIDNNGNSLNIIDDFTMINIIDPCESVTTVTFNVEDSCGSNSSCSRDIVITDTQAPSIDCANDIQISIFSQDINVQVDDWLNSVAASDLCGQAQVEGALNIDLNNLECGEEYDVVFSAIDDCDNVSDCTANIKFTNDAFVSIDCPNPISVKCSEVFGSTVIDSFLNAYTYISEDDFDVTHNFDVNSVSTDCAASYTQIVTFEIVDACNNDDNCETSISFIPDGKIYIPNTFSPNGDGDNDWFTVFGNESISKVKSMRIYNRWGDLVFIKDEEFLVNEEKSGWNGYYKNSPAQIGVYAYKIEIMDSFENTIVKTGSITVVK